MCYVIDARHGITIDRITVLGTYGCVCVAKEGVWPQKMAC